MHRASDAVGAEARPFSNVSVGSGGGTLREIVSMADEEPKIIIDEDWKAQVRREKEEAQRKADEAPAQEEVQRPAQEDEGKEYLGECSFGFPFHSTRLLSKNPVILPPKAS